MVKLIEKEPNNCSSWFECWSKDSCCGYWSGWDSEVALDEVPELWKKRALVVDWLCQWHLHCELWNQNFWSNSKVEIHAWNSMCQLCIWIGHEKCTWLILFLWVCLFLIVTLLWSFSPLIKQMTYFDSIYFFKVWTRSQVHGNALVHAGIWCKDLEFFPQNLQVSKEERRQINHLL